MPRTEIDEREDYSPVPPQVPRMEGPSPKPAEPPHTQRSAPKEFELRPGDSGDDRPPQIPKELGPLSDADLKALAEAEERLLQKELREAEELIASEPSVLGLSNWLSHPLMGSVAIGMAGVLGLFIYNQVTSALATMGSLQGFWMYGGYVALGVLAGSVLYAMLRLLWLYVRLRRNKQLRIKGLEELEKRIRELPAGKDVVAYCRGPYCVMAFRAVEILRARGRSARRLMDGFPEWRAAGLPVERSTAWEAA